MQLHLGVRLQKLGNLSGLVCGEVVKDDADLLLGFADSHHLAQKIDELFTGVTRRCLAVHLARFHIERGI